MRMVEVDYGDEREPKLIGEIVYDFVRRHYGSGLPSRRVVNEMLLFGLAGADMSANYTWEPTLVNDVEYELIKTYLVSQGASPSSLDENGDFADWSVDGAVGKDRDAARRITPIYREMVMIKRRLSFADEGSISEQARASLLDAYSVLASLYEKEMKAIHLAISD